jgi:peptide/nickel transport system ATP-binding protein
VEKGTAREIFKDPRHPYTIGLMNSKPVVGKHVDRLYSIPGNVPNPINMPDYCYFRDRCEMCVKGCEGSYPNDYYVSPTHMVSCYRCQEGGTENA